MSEHHRSNVELNTELESVDRLSPEQRLRTLGVTLARLQEDLAYLQAFGDPKSGLVTEKMKEITLVKGKISSTEEELKK